MSEAEASRPLVSVIVLTLNQRDTILRALRSVVAQNTDVPYEVIVSDDGSTDGTVEAVRQFAATSQKNIRLLTHERLGIIGNYHYALSQARGRYIADCAGDDSWADPTMIERYTAILEDDTEVSIVYGIWRELRFDTGEQVKTAFPAMPSVTKPGQMTAAILSRQPGADINISAAIYRRSVLDAAVASAPQIFFNPDYRCEDLPVWIVMSEGGKMVFDPTVVLNYSVGSPRAISSTESFSHVADVYFGAHVQTIALEQWSATSRMEMSSFYKKRGAYLLAQIYRSRRLDLFHRFVDISHRHRLPYSLKGYVYRLLMELRIWLFPAR